MPSLVEALEYLGRLEGQVRAHAEEYVRKAPSQIDTPYRRAIVEQFDWNAVPIDASS